MIVSSRAETHADEEFVRRLVIEYSAAELAAESWPQTMRDHLLGVQYTARRAGARERYPVLDSRIVLADAKPVGWLVVANEGEAFEVIDVILLAAYRRHGIGSAVLRQILAEADHLGRPVRLSVRHNSPAIRLYERLGFRRCGGDELQDYMERP